MASSNYFILFLKILIFILTVTSGKEQNTKKAIYKCCPYGQNIIVVDFQKICVKPNNWDHKILDFSDVPLYDKNKKLTGRNVKSVYNLVNGIMKNDTFNSSSFDYSPYGHSYYLSEDEILFEEVPNTYNWWTELTRDKFCIDYKLDPETLSVNRPSFWSTTTDSGSSQNTKDIYVIGLFISCIFLAMTLVVYFLLPGPRTLSELVQMTYIASTLAAFLFLAVIMLSSVTFEAAECKGLSYATYFFLLASFSWLAVMSYDLWCLHSNFMKRSTKRKTTMRYRVYSACAWGVPAALTTFLIIVDQADMRHIPWFVTPNIPNNGCFLNAEPKLLYINIPMLVLIISNWVFFFMTSYNLWKQYRVTSTVDADYGTQKDHRKFKNRFFLYLKLSIITGISWVMEIISSFYPDVVYYIITDIYNMLIGFFMFLILVCNKRTFKKLRKRFEPNISSSKNDSVKIDQI